MAVLTTDPILMPPGPRLNKYVQGLGFLLARRRGVEALAKRFGPTFSINVPALGNAVVVGDPALIKDVFTTDAGLIGRSGSLGEVFGPGSTFSLDGDEHRRRRKLLVPPFHGKRMRSYEGIIEEEVLREVSNWPQGREFAVLPSTMRITLNAILRAVFGAEGATLQELADLLPKGVSLGAKLAVAPPIARRDLGPLSPWGRVQRGRRRYNEIVNELIAAAVADPDFEQRSDMLSLMLQARYEDGSPITHAHIADELLTFLAAGHETTATTLAWAIERIRRHPKLLARLAAEADDGGADLRQATIWEVQRVRSVIDATVRETHQPIRLGPWVFPAGTMILIAMGLVHADDANFTEAKRFDPDRFVQERPDTSTWLPYGGGVRRCPGAAFANMEMDVVLRTLLRTFEVIPTDAPEESVRSRGVATAPRKGGLIMVRRRAADFGGLVDSVSGAATAVGTGSSELRMPSSICSVGNRDD